MGSICNSIEIPANPDSVFRIVSDLAAWPRYLSHYRWIRIIETQPDHQIVRMACYRGWIPIDWVSRFHIDPKKRELHFTHLKAFTREMRVVWKLEPIRDGAATRVAITHELEPVVQRWGKFIAKRIIGSFFIKHVATRTLQNFARHFSGELEKLPESKK